MTDKSKTLLYKKITGLTEISVLDLDKLFKVATKRQLAKGESIVKHGQICNTIAFVEQGYLQTFIDRNGTESHQPG